jgi:hypothetical protein
MFDVQFYLGRVRSEAHLARLANVAAYLDNNKNKFSCTLSVVEGAALFDICPHDSVAAQRYDSPEKFRLYAAELTMHALVKELAHNEPDR